uniref:Uncharacterized protein n=1 Tax=Anguilla anguilla TaxID=7936 RepID=A0A0E9STL6_ANGAN
MTSVGPCVSANRGWNGQDHLWRSPEICEHLLETLSWLLFHRGWGTPI